MHNSKHSLTWGIFWQVISKNGILYHETNFCTEWCAKRWLMNCWTTWPSTQTEWRYKRLVWNVSSNWHRGCPTHGPTHSLTICSSKRLTYVNLLHPRFKLQHQPLLSVNNWTEDCFTFVCFSGKRCLRSNLTFRCFLRVTNVLKVLLIFFRKKSLNII